MSNEEKILAMLTKMRDDLEEIISLIENKAQPQNKLSQREVFEEMANLLDDDEKDFLGRYQRMEQARKDAFCERDTWILPANPNDYDVDAAFRELKIIEWAQPRSLKNIKLGDFVYIYESAPVKAIRWKCRVGLVNVEVSEIDDSKFSRTGTALNEGPFIWLEALCEYNVGDSFSYAELRKNGLNSTIRSPMKVKGQLLNYLKIIDEMADRNERN